MTASTSEFLFIINDVICELLLGILSKRKATSIGENDPIEMLLVQKEKDKKNR